MTARKYTIDELAGVFEIATIAGSKAATDQIKKLAAKPNASGKMLDVCGGAILHLRVDGRSGLGKLLAGFQHPSATVRKDYRGGFVLDLPYSYQVIPPVNGQEASIFLAADSAAAKIIESQLGVEAFAIPYID